ncbi:MAG: pyruvate dehydrogenase (acetyl-transferring), homodimeric type [Gammaproteobacteria bacterium]|nr:pyruvate dehydrogenase (acetyl-transferring), homodimeric type [Gammaproteobacteria bacterium]
MLDHTRNQDLDPEETREWLDSLRSVIAAEGLPRAHDLIEKLIDQARRSGAYLPYTPNTAYLNTIHPNQQPQYPGNMETERRIEAYLRWNAMAMVVRANREHSGIGGHIATYASATTIYEVGFNHFWRGPNDKHRGDMIYFQGHASPGMYARSFLEGRLTEDQLKRFRRDALAPGLASYPHPRTMPDYWQYPTVSMGLGPIQALYQARFMRYMEHRGLIEPSDRKVWAMLGDGEMDEPESRAALDLPVREKLDNLVYLVNCNLQRLDGPVRGNGKIIQELEATFRGAGWNVIKVVWGSRWDALLAKDDEGLLRKRMEECVDGDYQRYKSRDGAYVREEFFNSPELKAMVAHLSDEQVWALNRGGNDAVKLYAAYKAATEHKGQPTLILVKSVKGYGMGKAGQGKNIAHQQKKLSDEDVKAYRDRLNVPVPDDQLEELPFIKPGEDSPEMRYLNEHRETLGGSLPARIHEAPPLEMPAWKSFEALTTGTGDREISTMMAVMRLMTALTRDKNFGPRIVPIVPDEARTFGMEGLFRQVGIYSPVGQLYEPEDADQLMHYKEDKGGQILQEGITEAGCMSSWLAAATSYANHGVQMVPFYFFYSMFGFQRFGDLAWAAGDMHARGFLIAGTAGRTTMEGEGLQHDDGNSHIYASVYPSCIAYDPTYNYEVAIIVREGIRRMFVEQEDVFYYITCMNENYYNPPMPEGAEEGIIRGMYKFKSVGKKHKLHAQLLGSGTILREAEAAAEMLDKDWKVASDVWSVTSYEELRREGLKLRREDTLHASAEPQKNWVARCLEDTKGPIVAASDYNKYNADKIREFVPRHYITLGTDGYGRSDVHRDLRRFFEVDREHIVVNVLKALADEGELPYSKVAEAIEKYDIDADAPPRETI